MNHRRTYEDPSRELDLAVLLERSARGDAESFSRFYDATAASAFGLALRVVGNRALAEEVTQEAYLGLWRAAGQFDRDRGTALSFLVTIVHRRAVDTVRATHAAVGRDRAYYRKQPTVEHDATAEAAQGRLDATRVRGALAGLTPKHRRAIELAYFDGLTQAEVAATLGIPLGTVKTWIRSGLIALRQLLDCSNPASRSS